MTTIQPCDLCLPETSRQFKTNHGRSSHIRLVHGLDRIPNSSVCPSCGRLVWSGGPPTQGEFPIICSGCERRISLRDVGVQPPVETVEEPPHEQRIPEYPVSI